MVLSTPSAGRVFVTLAGDFTNDTIEGGAGGDVTDFGFVPAPDTRYYVEGVLLVRSSATTIGPRPGIKWPTVGIVDQAAYLRASIGGSPSAATIHHMEGALLTAQQVLQLGGLASISYSYAVILHATFETGPTVTGDFQIVLFSETGGNDVTLRAGSFLAIYSGHEDQ